MIKIYVDKAVADGSVQPGQEAQVHATTLAQVRNELATDPDVQRPPEPPNNSQEGPSGGPGPSSGPGNDSGGPPGQGGPAGRNGQPGSGLVPVGGGFISGGTVPGGGTQGGTATNPGMGSNVSRQGVHEMVEDVLTRSGFLPPNGGTNAGATGGGGSGSGRSGRGRGGRGRGGTRRGRRGGGGTTGSAPNMPEMEDFFRRLFSNRQ